MVTGELIGVAMECLNAEFKKTLALRTPPDAAEKPLDGLDRCIEERLKIPGKAVVPVIVDVLCSAGIAETTEIMDRVSHGRPGKESGCFPRGPGMQPQQWRRQSGSRDQEMTMNPPWYPG
jgi:hypothetical protein